MNKPTARYNQIRILDGFIGPSQWAAVNHGRRGEEAQFFEEKLLEMAGIVETMPKTYEQDGKGDEAIVYLHFFKGGADWFITEKDSDPPDEDGNHRGQQQAFGLADLFNDGGELGYISIVELLQNNVELDFHFTPRTLGQVKKERNRSSETCTFDDPLAEAIVLVGKVSSWRERYRSQLVGKEKC